jgi:hypothetical protein
MTVSRLVRESDAEFVPVSKVLIDNHFVVESSEIIEDETLWFGSGWSVIVRLCGPRTGKPPSNLFEELSMN